MPVLDDTIVWYTKWDIIISHIEGDMEDLFLRQINAETKSNYLRGFFYNVSSNLYLNV